MMNKHFGIIIGIVVVISVTNWNASHLADFRAQLISLRTNTIVNYMPYKLIEVEPEENSIMANLTAEKANELSHFFAPKDGFFNLN